MVDVDIGIILVPLPPIIQVVFLYCWFYLFMIMIEMCIGIIPANSLHITMVEYTLTTQGPLNKQFQWVYKKKIFETVIKAVSCINIKIIRIILIQSFHYILIQECRHTLIQI